MNTERQSVQPDHGLVCDECGRHGAIALDDRKLCPDCYASFGDCCSAWRQDKQEIEAGL